MNCKRCEKLIPRFMNNSLDIDDLREFIEHVEDCPNCKEELTIEFLVKEGLNSLEKGETFDLNGELKRRMLSSNNRVKRFEGFEWLYYTIAFMVGVAFVVMLILLVFA